MYGALPIQIAIEWLYCIHCVRWHVHVSYQATCIYYVRWHVAWHLTCTSLYLLTCIMLGGIYYIIIMPCTMSGNMYCQMNVLRVCQATSTVSDHMYYMTQMTWTIAGDIYSVRWHVLCLMACTMPYNVWHEQCQVACTLAINMYFVKIHVLPDDMSALSDYRYYARWLVLCQVTCTMSGDICHVWRHVLFQAT